MNSIERNIRRVIRALLPAAFFRAWITRLSARLSDAYSRLMVEGLKKPLPAEAPHRSRGSLERLLFVCDNMWEQRELLPELKKICDVEFLDVGPLKKARNEYELVLDEAGWKEAWGKLRGAAFDAIIVYLNSSLLTEEIVEDLRSWSCPLIGMNLDDKTTYAPYGILARGGDNYRQYAAKFDVNLTNARAMLDIYRGDGLPVLYLPTGFHCDEKMAVAKPPENFRYPLSFVGSWKPERAQFIHELDRRGIEVKIFGGGWEGAEFTDEGRRIYRESQINLGIGYNLPGDQFTNLKNRDFECPGAGGCYLTTYDWELAELFEIGKEILCYRNIEEFVEIYAHYSRRPEQCRKIAAAGQARAIREHTWEQRFRTIFTQLGFDLTP